MIRKGLILCVLSLATASYAGEAACKKQCDETVTQCKDMCKKQLGKTDPDKVGFCQQKCKEFTNECYKTCKNESEHDD